MKVIIACLLAIVLAQAGQCSEDFRDVPEDHWAAEAVAALADKGIVQGYPDGTYKGDRPVTRYELAVALERLITFIQESERPLTPPPADSSPQQPKSAQASVAFLAKGGFIPADSELLKDGDKPVTFEQLAEAISHVAAKLVELRTPAPEAPIGNGTGNR